jgi:hypothetical protein
MSGISKLIVDAQERKLKFQGDYIFTPTLMKNNHKIED